MGENLFYSESPYSWNKVISSWHGEVANFLYPNTSVNGGSIGHYTQVTAAHRYGYSDCVLTEESFISRSM